ncbi:MAG: 3-phosphoshikimate 1-carboxyvinyltransferase [Campylobacteraceae bacterium]|nr:3-phosphoshikimate 1-carboxyvinyltransferase [Campylobacteraceae bacterium]
MESINIEAVKQSFNKTIDTIASDKSISHRCAMFSIFSNKTSKIKNFLTAEDTLNSLSIIEQLGASVKRDGSYIEITPNENFIEPEEILDCGNAGTGMRLFTGLLSSMNGAFVLSGDKYLNNRPMNRVVKPLRSIGANIDGRENGNKAPLFIRGGTLKAFTYTSPIDSAQIKSAMILAALKADGICKYKENELTRDHTERMLKGMGADIFTDEEGFINISPLKGKLKPLEITVPTDPSSAFFFAVAAAITPNAKVVLKNVTLNPTRIEAYKILEKMGAKIEFILKENKYEPMGDIVVEQSELKPVHIKDNIPWLIDELPALAIAMACAKGISKVSNAKELRVKESDRIASVVNNLKLCNINFNEFDDGYEIIGGNLQKASIDSHGDHRIAMSFAIAGLKCGMEIKDIECIQTSFPNFFDILDDLRKT